MNGDDAELWLSRRRGFIPQRSDTDVDQVLADRDTPFPQVVRKIMGLRKTGES